MTSAMKHTWCLALAAVLTLFLRGASSSVLYRRQPSSAWDTIPFWDSADSQLYDTDDLTEDSQFDYGLANADEGFMESKRARLQELPVWFYCNRKTAICRNGGRGPTVKMDKVKKKPLCTCMCPAGFTKPQCDRKPKSNHS